MNTYSIRDDNTGNVYDIMGYRPPSQSELNDIIEGERVRAFEDLSLGSYKYESHVSNNKLPEEQRNFNLQKDTALALNVGIDDVDVSTGVAGLWQKTNLDFRKDPREKFDYLEGQYGKGSITSMIVDGKPRMLLDTKGKDGQPKYMFIDSEGFTFSDLGDIAGDIPRIAVAGLATTALVGSAGLDVASMGATKLATLGLQAGLVGYLTDFATKSTQDYLVGEFDRFFQEPMGIEKIPMDEYTTASLKQTDKEARVSALFDAGIVPAGKFLSSTFGNASKNAKNLLTQSTERLMKRYQDLNINLRVAGSQQKGGKSMLDPQGGVAYDRDLAVYSGAMQNLMQQNLEGASMIQRSLLSGQKSNLGEIQDFTAKNIQTNYENLNMSVAKGLNKDLEDALTNNLQRTLKNNDIRLSFNNSKGGKVLQNDLQKSFNIVKQNKNNLYGDVYNVAKQEGLDYNVFDVYKALEKTLRQSTDFADANQKEVLRQVNVFTGISGQYDNLSQLRNLVKAKPKGQATPNKISMKQLDDIIGKYGDDANYGDTYGKKGYEKFAEKFSNTLREVRNNKVINPTTGRALSKFKGTGDALIRAKNYYNNDYLSFFNLNKNNLLYRGAGGTYRDDYYIGGSKVMRSLLSDTDNVDKYLKLLQPPDRLKALDSLRYGYMKRMGADGEFSIGKSTPLKYDRDMIRELFQERNPITGDIIETSSAKRLVELKRRAIDDVNDIAKQTPKMLLNMSEDDILKIFRASTPNQISGKGGVLNKIRTIKNRQADIYKLESDSVLNYIAKTGEFAQHPDMYAKHLLQADESVINNFIKAIQKKSDDIGGEEVVDSIKSHVVMRLLELAKRNGGNTVKILDDPLFNPDDMIKQLTDNSQVAQNAKKVLGKEIVQDLIDLSSQIKYSTPLQKKGIGESVRPVFSNAGLTVVLSNLPDAVARKIMGVAMTNKALMKMLTKETNPNIIARRLSIMFPLMYGLDDVRQQFANDANMDATMMEFIQEEMVGINQEINKTEQMLNLANKALKLDNTNLMPSAP